jgi:hypothetical protein
MYAASCIKRLLSDRKHLCEGESAALERTALVNLLGQGAALKGTALVNLLGKGAALERTTLVDLLGQSATLEGTALVDLVEDKLHVGEKHLVGWWVEKSVTWKLMLVIEGTLHGKRRCLTQRV